MGKIKVGDKVFVKADAPEEYNTGDNIIFTHLLGDVHWIKKGIAEVGVSYRKLHVPVEYLAHADDVEERKKVQEAEFDRYPEFANKFFGLEEEYYNEHE